MGTRRPLSLSLKGNDLKDPRKRTVEVYNKNIIYPAGTTNPANICYANCVLFNHEVFVSVINQLKEFHSSASCGSGTSCKPPSMSIFAL